MENHNHTNSSDELMHFGRKGMKWYQNIFTKDKKTGSGKKKDSDDDDDNSKSKDSKGSSSGGKKSASEMSEAELISAINHLQLEKRYRDLQKEMASDMDSDSVKKGDGFVKEFWDKSAKPAIQEGSKAVIKDVIVNMGKKMLGDKAVEVEDAATKLAKEATNAKNEWTKLNYQQKIKELREDGKTASKSKEDNDPPKTDPPKNDAPKNDAPKNDPPKSDPKDSFNYYFDSGSQRRASETVTRLRDDEVEIITPSTRSTGQSFVSGYLGSNALYLEDKSR